jgi:hypothetical protein
MFNRIWKDQIVKPKGGATIWQPKEKMKPDRKEKCKPKFMAMIDELKESLSYAIIKTSQLNNIRPPWQNWFELKFADGPTYSYEWENGPIVMSLSYWDYDDDELYCKALDFNNWEPIDKGSNYTIFNYYPELVMENRKHRPYSFYNHNTNNPTTIELMTIGYNREEVTNILRPSFEETVKRVLSKNR